MGNYKSKTNVEVQSIQYGIKCSAPVKVLLDSKLQQMYPQKEMMYKQAISRINDSDKQVVMSYIKCKDQLFLPEGMYNQIEINLLQTSMSYSYNQTKTCEIQMEWFVNFSDKILFGYYNSQLLAQDEIQCIQFPLLPHIREYIQEKSEQQEGLYPVTRVGLKSHPILVTNCQLLCSIDCQKQSQKFPRGIYGNEFVRADDNDLKDLVNYPQKNDKKQLINLICMTALNGKDEQAGKEYLENEIIYTFETALKAFYAAVVESRKLSEKRKVIINTGNWGTGAFGNNLPFMVLVQLTAAHLAGVNQLNYYPFDQSGQQGFAEGHSLYLQFITLQAKMDARFPIQFVQSFIKFCLDKQFKWGQPNGS